MWAYRTGQLQVIANLTDDPVPRPEDFGELVLRTGQEQPELGPWEGMIARQRVSESYRQAAGPAGYQRHERTLAASSRPMTIRWIWFVPSTIWSTLASRISRSAGKSST